MEHIIAELDDNRLDRDARFVCSIVVATPDGEIIDQVEGICSGHIAAKPSGTNGFGYDPIFIPSNFVLTFGDLNNEIKNEISHRSDALRKIIPKLRGFFAY
jgi:XTP/dITP diphosphohydrolase